MIRQIEVTVLAATTVASSNITKIKTCKGTLSKVVVRPAPGPNWEVYFRILHMHNAIIPDSNSEWIPLEREALEFYPHFTEWKGLYELTIEFCSPQANYPHVIQIEIDIQETPDIVETMQDFIAKGL